MSRPTVGKPGELIELGRTAEPLFDVLRHLFGVDERFPLDLRAVDCPVEALAEPREVAAIAMRSTQMLRHFAAPMVRVRSEDVVTLLDALALGLEWLLAPYAHDPDDPVVGDLRRMHRQVADAGFKIAAYCNAQLCYLE